jgi:hypothetical protein
MLLMKISMDFRSVFVSIISLSVLASVEARAGFTIDQGFAIGPNGASGSPSYPTWQINAVQGITAGFTDVGNFATDPTAFHVVTSTNVRDVIPTDNFNSWLGQASPTGAFAGELGNLLYTPVHINGGGTQFSLSQVVFSSGSSDNPGNPPASLLGVVLDLSAFNYSTGRVGVVHHGSGPSTYITSGSSSQLVDELIYRGVGVFDVLLTQPGLGQTDQQVLDGEAAHLSAFGNLTLTATYTIYADASHNPTALLASGTDSLVIAAVPEPSTFAAMGLGGLTLALVARRRRTARA